MSINWRPTTALRAPPLRGGPPAEPSFKRQGVLAALGRDGARRRIAPTRARCQCTHLEDVLANGTHLVALLHLRAQSGAMEIDMRRVNVYRVNPDGRVSERWGYVGDQAAFDDLFA